MTESSTDPLNEGLKDPITGIAYAKTVDLEGYEPGEDVDDDSLVIAEVIAFRERTGISLPNTIDLDEYLAGDDVDDDALLVAELRAFRELGTKKGAAS